MPPTKLWKNPLPLAKVPSLDKMFLALSPAPEPLEELLVELLLDELLLEELLELLLEELLEELLELLLEELLVLEELLEPDALPEPMPPQAVSAPDSSNSGKEIRGAKRGMRSLAGGLAAAPRVVG